MKSPLKTVPSAADRVRFISLTAKQRDALMQLRHEDQLMAKSGGLRNMVFPGAIGRPGSSLVRRGLVVNRGYTVFSGNGRGERPDAYVVFEFTALGKEWAESIFRCRHEGRMRD